MSSEFKNRVFGAVILKSINSNFNADFTHHPRTLPDGVVYSTDKALKYAIKDYFRKTDQNKKLFYVKRYNKNINPLTLDETYKELFGDYPTEAEIVRMTVLSNLLSCWDVRLFGATFAGKTNISIHGPVQINHGINKFKENDIYSEDILSPFRNPGAEGSDEKGMSTIGNQTNLKEGHYVFHFSINPKNTEEFYAKINEGKSEEDKKFLSDEDIKKLKEAFNSSVTALDSSRKMGTENEAVIWIQLNDNSKKMFPSITEMVNVEKLDDKIKLGLMDIKTNIDSIDSDVSKVEIFYNPSNTQISGLDKSSKVKHYNILNGKEIEDGE